MDAGRDLHARERSPRAALVGERGACGGLAGEGAARVAGLGAGDGRDRDLQRREVLVDRLARLAGEVEVEQARSLRVELRRAARDRPADLQLLRVLAGERHVTLTSAPALPVTMAERGGRRSGVGRGGGVGGGGVAWGVAGGEWGGGGRVWRGGWFWGGGGGLPGGGAWGGPGQGGERVGGGACLVGPLRRPRERDRHPGTGGKDLAADGHRLATRDVLGRGELDGCHALTGGRLRRDSAATAVGRRCRPRTGRPTGTDDVVRAARRISRQSTARRVIDPRDLAAVDAVPRDDPEADQARADASAARRSSRSRRPRPGLYGAGGGAGAGEPADPRVGAVVETWSGPEMGTIARTYSAADRRCR